ncbi:hypothetical protein MNB_SV-14-535 [hydrothermal vent metagenome]|uniref:Uncharacterized protein n=1 Tax=hydrothermal vent metagenome TaxID=652676 RepID=A0A1W1CTX3_9ZZZZ
MKRDNLLVSSLISLLFAGCVIVDNSSTPPIVAPKEKLDYIDNLMVEKVYGSDIYREDEDNFIEGLKQELKSSSKVHVSYRSPYRLSVYIDKIHLNEKKKKGKFLGSVQYRYIQDVIAKAKFDLRDRYNHLLLSDRTILNSSMDTGSSRSFRDAREQAKKDVFKDIGKRVAEQLSKYLKK